MFLFLYISPQEKKENWLIRENIVCNFCFFPLFEKLFPKKSIEGAILGNVNY